MIVYALLTLGTVIIALGINNHYEKLPYGYSRQQVLNGLCLVSVFLLLFAVSALRLNVGNDYATYVEYFHLIRCKLDTEVVVPTEPGFNLVCLLIYFISGKTENYLLMFAVFAFVTIFLFMKGIYRQADNFAFSFFLFMTLGYYFQTFSTVRYYLALAMAFAAIPYVLRKEWLKFFLVVILGATFHKSILIIIPLYFLAQWSWKKWQYVIAAAGCATFFLFKDFYMKLFYLIYPTYEDVPMADSNNVVGIIRCVLVLIFALIMFGKIKEDNRLKFFFYCNIGALLLYVCCSFLPSVSRAVYYLSVTHILFVPALILKIDNKKLRVVMTVLTVIGCLGYFATFLMYKAAADGLRILPYQTFMFHDMVNILSEVG